MQVPISALFRTHGNWSVFHVLDGRARLTKVEIGHMNDDVAEIIDGLRSGDAVVLHPSDTIADGSLLALSEN
jgi:HlyD family secretion protein